MKGVVWSNLSDDVNGDEGVNLEDSEKEDDCVNLVVAEK